MVHNGKHISRKKKCVEKNLESLFMLTNISFSQNWKISEKYTLILYIRFFFYQNNKEKNLDSDLIMLYYENNLEGKEIFLPQNFEIYLKIYLNIINAIA